MRTITKILVLSFCLLILGATTAMAFGEIRYPDRPLNLRDGRSPKNKWVGSLYPGQKVKIGFIKDGWAAVFEPWETRASEAHAVGYSNIKYLLKKQTRVEIKPWGEMVQASRNLNIRSTPNRNGKRVDMLESGQVIRIDFPEDDWSMIFDPRATIRSKMNGIGYCSTKYLEAASTASVSAATKKPASEPTQAKPVVSAETASNGEWGKLVTITRKINLRKGRTTGSKYIRTLKPGERVRLDYLKSGWYAVFMPNESARKESRAMGYVLQSLADEGSEAVVAAGVKSAAVETAPVIPVEKAVQSVAVTPASEKETVSTNPLIKPRPAAKQQAAALGGTQKSMVIDRTQFKETKRPDPTPNKSAHGYQYRLLEKAETKKFGETWITLKVFLATTKLPGSEGLRDFATTLWKEHKKTSKNLAVLVYVPGQDTEDLAYGVVQFNDKEMLELWVRKATLFGTDFL